MEKPCPASGGAVRLRVGGCFAAHRSSLPGRPQDVHYEIVAGDAMLRLEDELWADWTSDGRLLLATRDGPPQIRDRSRHRAVTFDADLATLTPAPLAPPDQAHHW